MGEQMMKNEQQLITLFLLFFASPPIHIFNFYVVGMLWFRLEGLHDWIRLQLKPQPAPFMISPQDK